MLRKIIIALLVLGMVGVGIAYLQYNKSHRDIVAEEATIEVTAVALFDAYATNEKGANKMYLDQVMVVSGEILELDKVNNMVVFKTEDDFGTVNASFDEPSYLEGLTEGKQIEVKGHCTGGDDLGVIITHCSILK